MELVTIAAALCGAGAGFAIKAAFEGASIQGLRATLARRELTIEAYEKRLVDTMREATLLGDTVSELTPLAALGEKTLSQRRLALAKANAANKARRAANSNGVADTAA